MVDESYYLIAQEMYTYFSIIAGCRSHVFNVMTFIVSLVIVKTKWYVQTYLFKKLLCFMGKAKSIIKSLKGSV